MELLKKIINIKNKLCNWKKIEFFKDEALKLRKKHVIINNVDVVFANIVLNNTYYRRSNYGGCKKY